MNIEQLREQLANFLKDIRLNLSQVLTEDGSPHLTQKQIYMVGLACAYSTRNQQLIKAMIESSITYLTETEQHSMKSAAVIMGMNNIYYRFTHLVKDKNFINMPARLRMNVLGNPGVDKIDFELACLAVSAINGCGMCMDAHVQELKKSGVNDESIQSAVRIASVLNATSVALNSI
jgi:lipoyl-dependent peroxiredoxin subunit D